MDSNAKLKIFPKINDIGIHVQEPSFIFESKKSDMLHLIVQHPWPSIKFHCQRIRKSLIAAVHAYVQY